jgi:hypothetical protein
MKDDIDAGRLRLTFHFYRGELGGRWLGRIGCYRGVTFWVWRCVWSVYW